jgi:hypothetical protein
LATKFSKEFLNIEAIYHGSETNENAIGLKSKREATIVCKICIIIYIVVSYENSS